MASDRAAWSQFGERTWWVLDGKWWLCYVISYVRFAKALVFYYLHMMVTRHFLFLLGTVGLMGEYFTVPTSLVTAAWTSQ